MRDIIDDIPIPNAILWPVVFVVIVMTSPISVPAIVVYFAIKLYRDG